MPAFHVRGGEAAKYTVLFAHANAEDLGMLYHHFVDSAARLQAPARAAQHSSRGFSRVQ